jgi:hypothetical protein
MQPRNPPAWVPPQVSAVWASTAKEASDQARLDRLVFSRDMKPVWDWLTAKSVQDKDLPLDFLVKAHVLPHFWESMSKTPTKQAMRDIKEMEDGARQLASQLREHEAEVRLLCGFGNSLLSLIAEIDRRKELEIPAEQLMKQNNVTYLLTGERLIPDLADVLEELAEKLARAKLGAVVYRRPTKPNDANAERTYCVQYLAQFFKECTGEIPRDVIARTVNEILDIGGTTPLDAQHVGKLLKR